MLAENTELDPSANPRYLGDELIKDPGADEERRGELGRQAAMWAQMLDTLTSPGWEHIFATLKAAEMTSLEALVTCPPDKIEYHRAKLSHTRWMLQLPEQTRLALETTHQQLRDIAAEHEEE